MMRHDAPMASEEASAPLLCGVELGGTKCVCALGTASGEIRSQAVVPTGSDPALTLGLIEELLRGWCATHGTFRALGIASFGPLELRRTSPNYGRIGATTKPGWSHCDVAGFFRARFGEAVGLSTDVIGAALAEARWGAARELTDFAYVTVGTGVGVGLISGGRPLLGWHHPELGHIRVPRMAGDSWPGACRFHGDCVEGLASGPAIEARAGRPAARVASGSPVWETVAHALAQLAHTLMVATAPQRILMGGGVMSAQPQLFALIRERLRGSLNGYLPIDEIPGGWGALLAPPGLGVRAGPLGALAVAADVLAAGVNVVGAAAPEET
jgi:fructokinase